MRSALERTIRAAGSSAMAGVRHAWSEHPGSNSCTLGWAQKNRPLYIEVNKWEKKKRMEYKWLKTYAFVFRRTI